MDRTFSLRKTLSSIVRTVGETIQFFLLAIVYIVFMVPYGFLYRLLEPRLTRHFFMPRSGSYFIASPKRYVPKDFETTW